VAKASVSRIPLCDLREVLLFRNPLSKAAKPPAPGIEGKGASSYPRLAT
jgi:hypothetical protein